MDYTLQTWVDDDGSGGVGTVFTKARMDHIEAGVQDAARHHTGGLDSAKPVASAANAYWRYYATDTRIEYQSDGVSWIPLSMAPAGPAGGDLSGNYPNPGVNKLGRVNTRFGVGGTIHSFNNAYVVLDSNWTGDSNLLLDTTRPSWRVEMDGRSGSDYWRVLRAPPTSGAPVHTPMFTIDSAGQLSTGNNIYARVGAANQVIIGSGGPGGEAGVLLGADVSIYRATADVLATQDALAVIRASSGLTALGLSVFLDPFNRAEFSAGGVLSFGSGGSAPDLSVYRDTSARAHLEGTVAGDTVAMIRNKSATGLSGWQLNDQNDVARGFMGWANNAVTASQYMRINPGTNPLRLMYNAVTRYENDATGMAWWGATPIARPARPTTLAEVINVLANYGLTL